ncbi:unnamed protein product [Paramecium sonneborni]|nr:unnamed protein product [Paramecium sonneborni]
MVAISQITVYVFFLLGQTEFEFKKDLLLSLIIFLFILCAIDPRYFNQGRIKALYLTILFILSDITVIFQLNYFYNFIQFTLLFMLIQFTDVKYNVLISKIIYNAFNPIKINHQIFKGNQQINMNSMIILTQEFDIGPSLFSVFIGNFGCHIIGIASLFFNKINQDRHQIIGALIISSISNLLLDSLQILNYNQSINNTNEMIEQQIGLLNSLPLKLLELILYNFGYILLVKEIKQKREN